MLSSNLHKGTTPPQPNHTVTPTHIEPEQYNTWNKSTISCKLLKMDVLTFETCWAVNIEIIKQVTSSWSIFIQLTLFFFKAFLYLLSLISTCRITILNVNLQIFITASVFKYRNKVCRTVSKFLLPLTTFDQNKHVMAVCELYEVIQIWAYNPIFRSGDRASW